MAEDVVALSPRCIVCSSHLGSSDHPLSQFHCLHAVCPSCAPDTFQPTGVYKCPIDDLECPGLYTNEPLAALIQQYWNNTHTEFAEGLRAQLLSQMKNIINYSNVPCFSLSTSSPCANLSCPYVHSFTQVYQRYPCPKKTYCQRKSTFCLFSHPEFAVPMPLYDSQTSFRYAQIEPSQLHEGVVLQPSLPMTSQRVTHTEVSRETALFTTIERRVEANSGYVYLQSLSLYRFLTANSSAELDALLGKYFAKAQMKTLKIIRKKSINWSYSSSEDTRRHFNIATSQLLEKAFKDNVEEVAVADNVVVNLRLMIKIHSGAVYTPVFRKESITSTSHAAVMELISVSDNYEIINKEIQLLEQSLLIPEDVPGGAVESVIEDLGLAVNQEGWLKGVKSDLLTAGKRLKCIPLPEKVSHIKLKPGTNLDLLKTVSQQFGLVQLNNLLIGHESALRRVREEDLSVDQPILSTEARRLICVKYGIREVSGKWLGRVEPLSDALAEITEATEQLPKDVSITEIRWLMDNFPVKVDNLSLVGPKNSVKEAIEQMLKQRKGAVAAEVPHMAEMPKNGFEPWYFSQKEGCKLAALDPRGPEYNVVMGKIEQHLKHDVVSIRRIYNKKQYLSYMLKLNKLRDEEKQQIAETELFHSSRRFNAEEMAQSDDGFKFKFTYGSWGTGFYFSEKAEKALENGFEPRDKPGFVMIFLCSVITGRSAFMKANRSLRRPPLAELGRNPYHSVVGNGVGSTMWVVYEPDMGRMKYLITFRTRK